MKIYKDYQANGMTLWKCITGLLTLNPFYLIVLHRIAHILWVLDVPLIPYILQAIGKVLYSADISPEAFIGKGIRFAHTSGIVIGPKAIIGPYCQIFQNVTIGGRARENRHGGSMPTLGPCVSVFAGAMLLGPIYIGEGAVCGAGAVVLKDVEPFAIMVGNPAKQKGKVTFSDDLLFTMSALSMLGYLKPEKVRKLVSEITP
jgi:serine O-acetyltransferase